MNRRERIVAEVRTAVGVHDQPEIYGGPAGDPGLIGPGSVSWELHADVGSVAVAGLAAIVMEVLHPLVMAGVHDQSDYAVNTGRRARNTFGYVMITTFGSTAAATRTIEHVRRMHERVSGTAPDGRPYRAMDPELIGWVHTAIPWAIMEAYHRYHRPLTLAERNRYLREQSIIGKLGGAGDIPVSMDELDAYVTRMRPKLAVNEQTVAFIAFLTSSGKRPGEVAPATEQLFRRLSLRGSLGLFPAWARELVGMRHDAWAQRTFYDPFMHTQAKQVRWAMGKPAYAQLAEARVRGVSPESPVALHALP
jgi:uncharacterized protein (DUF2236 family)